jgi:ubiquitin-protein ligase
MHSSPTDITFACGGCGQQFSLPASFAGRKATCKSCGAPIVVPSPAAQAQSAADAPSLRLPPRTRRLIAESQQMVEFFKGFALIEIKSTIGDPPEIYQVEYRVGGLARGWRNKPRSRDTHLVEIALTSDYPRLAPQCKMLTPIFHPNIDQTTICVGDHWTAGERLVDLVIRIGQMIAFQDYNIKSPLDGEAAMWADLNRDKLPTDKRDLVPPTAE